eukprot:TRINITY_DN23754_c0_g1_i1.p2 TRINITY_DN23754_c0_g1~~TRINITY_DN23754_c0_g1_i1.p2  ORF type:complete len:244 (+),score=44.17 TRINITY_DN23754_c0_g1_i1:230-961(+)
MTQSSAAASSAAGLFGFPSQALATSAKKRKGPDAATRANGADKADDQRLNEVAVLSLITANAVATVHAVVTDVLIFEANSPVAIATKKASTEFHALVQNTKREDRHTLGPPYIRVWQAVMEASMGVAAKAEEPSISVEPIKQYGAIVAGLEPWAKIRFLTETVRQCRVSPCHDKSKVKLQISVKAGATLDSDANPVDVAWLTTQRILVKHMGAEKKMGKAPQGAIERKLAQKYSVRTKKEDEE